MGVPKPFHSGLPTHFVRRLPKWRAYPNPFNKSLRALLGFLIFANLREQAPDVVLN
jgi:hypothetical protein